MISRSIAAACLAAALALGSCSSRLGWGVTLWTAVDGPLPAGSVVPVHIVSNIEKMYVVGVPGTKKKIELPLWQVELFATKAKAQARVAELGENATLYMVAARDGIPIRDKSANTGLKVFRLREGQSVKILA
ncbi:MAG: SH3 domain-containing protein, partial [Spirochaetaceae bacterium]|nr:SH3 domain-containing protein [Spirochaetaceae bacterium]